MKHKAQEAFKYFDIQQCRNCQKLTCAEYDAITKKEKNIVKESLDCQIPYKYLQMLCIVVKENIDRLEKKARRFEREGKFSDLAVYSELIEQHKQIIEVLHKQKEMWEEDK